MAMKKQQPTIEAATRVVWITLAVSPFLATTCIMVQQGDGFQGPPGFVQSCQVSFFSQEIININEPCAQDDWLLVSSQQLVWGTGTKRPLSNTKKVVGREEEIVCRKLYEEEIQEELHAHFSNVVVPLEATHAQIQCQQVDSSQWWWTTGASFVGFLAVIALVCLFQRWRTRRSSSQDSSCQHEEQKDSQYVCSRYHYFDFHDLESLEEEPESESLTSQAEDE